MVLAPLIRDRHRLGVRVAAHDFVLRCARDTRGVCVHEGHHCRRGCGGLTTGLMLHARGIDCEVYEQSDGIANSASAINTLRMHQGAERVGLLERLDAVAIRTTSCSTESVGQEVWHELRGHDAASRYRQFSIHRAAARRDLSGGARRLGERHFPRPPARLVPAGRFRRQRLFFDRNGSHRATRAAMC